MKRFLFLLLLTYSFTGISQSLAKRVLFLGNSYTNRNNLPNLLINAALSTGDTIMVDSNTPGGYTLQGHSTNQSSLSKIALGTWDYVVLQEQSQRPSFPDIQVAVDVFPYAKHLDSLIEQANPCAETVFYMTWGRKNGDASNCAFFPPLCTYQGMDSLLNLRYRHMADTNFAIVSPVGAVWNYIRTTYPTIELYTADESHPSLAGSYAAACTFYATILRKDPTLITFNSTLSALEANQIKNAAKLIVFDSLLNWNVGKYDMDADFTIIQNGFQVEFKGTLDPLVNHLWEFGDGNTDTIAYPIHQYSGVGVYTISHITTKCGQADSVSQSISILHTSKHELTPSNQIINVFPNPAVDKLTIQANNIINEVRLISTSGQVLLELRNGLNQSEVSLNLVDVISGIYFLEVKTADNQSLFEKVLIF